MNQASAFHHAVAKGQDPKSLSAISAEKSDQELRQLVLSLAVGCTVAQDSPGCPIRPLQGLTHVTLRNTVDRFDRETCLDLLREEATCRSTNRECGRYQALARLPAA
jgi:hypothetical protein